MQTFSKEKALRFGWETVKKNMPFLMGLALFVGLVNSVPFLIDKYARERVGEFILPLNITLWFLRVLLNMGVINISVRLVDGQPVRPRDLIDCMPLFFRYLVASLIFSLMILVGFILLIVPGIYLGLKYQFYDYFIVDKKMGILEAFSMSERITGGILWELFFFVFIILVFNALGFIFFYIGLLVTIPVSMIAMAHVYRQLESKLRTG
jgi:uncharacterized membrane protein